jgi:hypothetical protein
MLEGGMVQQFDGDRPLEHLVVCAVDCAHAAVTERLHESIPSCQPIRYRSIGVRRSAEGHRTSLVAMAVPNRS